MAEKITNPNDFKVVSFHNSTEFGFTPEMGCMYDGRPINGNQGGPGINAGETMTLPYHIGHQLALNLAKISLVRTAPALDPAGIPTGVPLWDTVRLDTLKNSYLKELYTEERPVALTETDKLMAKVEEYKKMVESLISSVPTPAAPTTETKVPTISPQKQAYLDKQDVIKELERRGVKHDKRKNKDELEKLLVA